MEAVLFQYYACPACGQANIIVDLGLLPGGRQEDVLRRRALEEAVRGLRGEQVELVLTERER
jgi:hypothetical protein